MATARQKASWGATGEVLAAIYNTVRDSKRRPEPFAGRDFDPYAPPPPRRGIEAFGSLVGLTPYQSRRIAEGGSLA
jgi:hypothetical protein